MEREKWASETTAHSITEKTKLFAPMSIILAHISPFYRLTEFQILIGFEIHLAVGYQSGCHPET